MRIILEGFDGTGKSTLQAKICDECNVLAYKWTGRPKDRGEYLGNLTLAPRSRLSPL